MHRSRLCATSLFSSILTILFNNFSEAFIQSALQMELNSQSSGIKWAFLALQMNSKALSVGFFFVVVIVVFGFLVLDCDFV